MDRSDGHPAAPHDKGFSRVKRRVVLTCAVTGDGPIHPKFPNYPITPQQIAAACLEAATAGASVVHVHARDPETGIGSRDPLLFREIHDRVRERNSEIILNFSAGMGATYLPDPHDEAKGLPGSDMANAEERLLHVAAYRPEICTLDVTTLNLEGGIAGAESCVYMNTTRTLALMAQRIRDLQVRPEIETFNPGDILLARQMITDGLIADPAMYQLCLGVRWGAPADAASLLYMRGLLPADAHWAAFGVSRNQMPVVAMATVMGGHCRVGLEDNIYLDRGVFATNGQLVDRANVIIDALGAAVATPTEARTILGLTH
jgi:uncharacterized protein (DUF849 family)